MSGGEDPSDSDLTRATSYLTVERPIFDLGFAHPELEKACQRLEVLVREELVLPSQARLAFVWTHGQDSVSCADPALGSHIEMALDEAWESLAEQAEEVRALVDVPAGEGESLADALGNSDPTAAPLAARWVRAHGIGEGDTYWLLHGLRGSEEELDLLRDVVRGATAHPLLFLRATLGYAASRLGQLAPTALAPALRERMDAGTHDLCDLQWILTRLEDRGSDPSIAKLLALVVSLEREAPETVAPGHITEPVLAFPIPSLEAMREHWLTRGFTPRSVARGLRNRGITVAATHPSTWPADGFGCLHALFGARFGRFQAEAEREGEAEDFEALKDALLQLVPEEEVGGNLACLVDDAELMLPWWEVNRELASLEPTHRLWPVGAPSNPVGVVLAPTPGFLAVAKALRIPLSEYDAP